MKKKLMKIGAGVLSLTMAMSTGLMNVEAAEKKDQPEPLKIGVVSDTHYFSESLYGAGDDFTTAMNSDRKMLKESGAILDSTLREMIKDRPDVVMVSGDLTKDGEEVNHREFAKKLEDAKKQLPDTKFYVINGNHDINNPNGKDFHSGTAQDADPTTVEEFRDIYAEFGYGDDTEQYKPNGTDAGSLSYVAHPAEGYTLIAVDSCKYSADQTASGQDLQETGGVIGEDLLNWISEKAKEAKEDGDVVMVLEHHGVIPHFSQEPAVMKDYLVDNYETVRETYGDSGVSYVFTGHMHANDIAEYTTAQGNKVYDIETGSLVTYPSLFRSVTIQAGTEKTQDGNSLVSEMKSPGLVTYKDFDTGEIKEITDLTAYAKTLTLSKEVICTMINEGVLTPALESLEQNGNVKGLLAELLNVAPEEVTSTLTTTLTGLLPQTKEEGISLSLANMQFLVYYSVEEQAIRFEQQEKSVFAAEAEEGVLVIPTKDGEEVRITLPQEIQDALIQAAQEEVLPQGEEAAAQEGVVERQQEPYAGAFSIALKITNEKLTACIDNLIGQVEDDFLKNGSLQRIVTDFVGNLLDGKVDEEHTVFDVVETVYQMHLAGNESREPWLNNAILKIQEGTMLPQIIKQSVTNMKETLAQEFSKLSISLGDLIEAGNDSFLTKTAVQIISKISLSGDQIINSVDDLGELIPNELLQPINELAYNVAESMSNDDNYKEDLNTLITIEGVKAWDEEEKPEENNGGNTGENNEGTTDPNGNNHGTVVKPAQKVIPKTGDQTPLVVTSVLLFGSAAVLLMSMLRKKNK